MVKDYKILTASSSERLEASVRAEMRNGWQPLGAVCLSFPSNGDYRYVQAMVLPA
jgi:hypothetical protein